jgi:hypothetical protein
MQTMTQIQKYYQAEYKSGQANMVMLELLYGPNPITDTELEALIAKRPHVYGKYAGYLGKRKDVLF